MVRKKSGKNRSETESQAISFLASRKFWKGDSLILMAGVLFEKIPKKVFISAAALLGFSPKVFAWMVGDCFVVSEKSGKNIRKVVRSQ